MRLGPGAPSRVALTRCMKRTGSASPVVVARSRSMTVSRVAPGSALTERISAMPSPAMISGKGGIAGREARKIDAQPFGEGGVDVGDAAFLVGGEEAGRRVVEMVDRLSAGRGRSAPARPARARCRRSARPQRLPLAWAR